MEAKNSITLYWCGKHKNWFVLNCPDCMLDANEADIKREGIKEVVEWIEHVRGREWDHGELWHCIPDTALQTQLKKWGVAPELGKEKE